jgi:hypothetical protein
MLVRNRKWEKEVCIIKTSEGEDEGEDSREKKLERGGEDKGRRKRQKRKRSTPKLLLLRWLGSFH